jgi:hypothetical protein
VEAVAAPQAAPAAAAEQGLVIDELQSPSNLLGLSRNIQNLKEAWVQLRA